MLTSAALSAGVGKVMKPHERQPQIEEIIRREGEASVEALAARFDVSSETIRRDLGNLAELGPGREGAWRRKAGTSDP